MTCSARPECPERVEPSSFGTHQQPDDPDPGTPTATRRTHLRVVNDVIGDASSPTRAHDARQLVQEGAIQHAALGAVDLELGGRLAEVTLAYRTWGELN